MRKWNFKRRLRKHTRMHKEFVPYDMLKNVVVLFESVGEQEDRVYFDIIRKLRADGKQVTAFAFMEKSKNQMYHHDGVTLFDKKRIGLLHVPDEELLTAVKACTCDVVFDFSTHTVLPLQYILLYIDAKCRVGIKCAKLLQPDFMIELPSQNAKDSSFSLKDLDFLFTQMLFYLKTIRSTP